MSFRADLLEKGVAEQQAAYLTQGFLELLDEQISLAAQDTGLLLYLYEKGRMDEADAVFRIIGRKLTEAFFSYKTASLLIENCGDEWRGGAC